MFAYLLDSVSASVIDLYISNGGTILPAFHIQSLISNPNPKSLEDHTNTTFSDEQAGGNTSSSPWKVEDLIVFCGKGDKGLTDDDEAILGYPTKDPDSKLFIFSESYICHCVKQNDLPSLVEYVRHAPEGFYSDDKIHLILSKPPPRSRSTTPARSPSPSSFPPLPTRKAAHQPISISDYAKLDSETRRRKLLQDFPMKYGTRLNLPGGGRAVFKHPIDLNAGRRQEVLRGVFAEEAMRKRAGGGGEDGNADLDFGSNRGINQHGDEDENEEERQYANTTRKPQHPCPTSSRRPHRSLSPGELFRTSEREPITISEGSDMEEPPTPEPNTQVIRGMMDLRDSAWGMDDCDELGDETEALKGGFGGDVVGDGDELGLLNGRPSHPTYRKADGREQHPLTRKPYNQKQDTYRLRPAPLNLKHSHKHKHKPVLGSYANLFQDSSPNLDLEQMQMQVDATPEKSFPEWREDSSLIFDEAGMGNARDGRDNGRGRLNEKRSRNKSRRLYEKEMEQHQDWNRDKDQEQDQDQLYREHHAVGGNARYATYNQTQTDDEHSITPPHRKPRLTRHPSIPPWEKSATRSPPSSTSPRLPLLLNTRLDAALRKATDEYMRSERDMGLGLGAVEINTGKRTGRLVETANLGLGHGLGNDNATGANTTRKTKNLKRRAFQAFGDPPVPRPAKGTKAAGSNALLPRPATLLTSGAQPVPKPLQNQAQTQAQPQAWTTTTPAQARTSRSQAPLPHLPPRPRRTTIFSAPVLPFTSNDLSALLHVDVDEILGMGREVSSSGMGRGVDEGEEGEEVYRYVDREDGKIHSCKAYTFSVKTDLQAGTTRDRRGRSNQDRFAEEENVNMDTYMERERERESELELELGVGVIDVGVGEGRGGRFFSWKK